MTNPGHQPSGSPSQARYVPGPDTSWPLDIIELIMADHRRIGRLRDVLYDAARQDGSPGPDWMPGHVWRRLAGLLVAHTQAEEEVCYLPMFGSGPQAAERLRDSLADHDDIREIIGEASLQPAGTASWWRVVRTVLAVSAEHLEREERDVLPDCLLRLSMDRRKELGRQWCAFIAAWREDATHGPALPDHAHRYPGRNDP